MHKLKPDYADAYHIKRRNASHVMGQTKLGILYLARSRLALKLLIHLVHHPQPRSTYGVTETFQPTVRLTGNRSAKIVEPGFYIFPGSPPGRDAQVFVYRELGDGETIVDFHHAYLFPGGFDTRLFIGSAGSMHCGLYMAEVPLRAHHLL